MSIGAHNLRFIDAVDRTDLYTVYRNAMIFDLHCLHIKSSIVIYLEEGEVDGDEFEGEILLLMAQDQLGEKTHRVIPGTQSNNGLQSITSTSA